MQSLQYVFAYCMCCQYCDARLPTAGSCRPLKLMTAASVACGIFIALPSDMPCSTLAALTPGSCNLARAFHQRSCIHAHRPYIMSWFVIYLLIEAFNVEPGMKSTPLFRLVRAPLTTIITSGHHHHPWSINITSLSRHHLQ